MTRWMYPPELGRERKRDQFDPISEGARYRLSRELSLAVWERVCADATDGDGRCDLEQALRRFDEIAVRLVAHGGRPRPDIGRITRVGVEVAGSLGAWSIDELRPRTPGKETQVGVAAQQRMVHGAGPTASEAPAASGVSTANGASMASETSQTREASVDGSSVGRAMLGPGWLPSATPPNVHARWHTDEHRMVTLYRRTVASGASVQGDLAIESALQYRGNGQPLPMALCRDMERELGVSLVGVRIHTDAVAARAARSLGAEAFTVGEDIFFADGAFAPDTVSGQKLIAHELTHVAQALRGGEASARGGVRVSEPGEPHEQEADAVAERVARVAAVPASAGPDAERPDGSRPTSTWNGTRLARLFGRASGAAESEDVHRAAQEGVDGGGGALPYLDQIQKSFGPEHDLSQVQAHVGGEASKASNVIQAEAYATGNRVAFRDLPSLRTAAHEAAHVVQQAAGVHLSGRVGQVGDDYERNADAVADRVVLGLPANDLLPGAGARSAIGHMPPARATQLAPPKSGGASGKPPSVPQVASSEPRARIDDPRTDAHYIDNVIDRVECMLIVADRYTLRWNGGHLVVFNPDIDWTKASKALPVFDVKPGIAAARSQVTDWNDVATSTGYERAVAFYRGEGGVLLPTWFSPETAPNTYELIMGVHRKVRQDAGDAEQFFRGMRNGLVVGMILGGVLRFVVRWPSGGGGMPEGSGDPEIGPSSGRPQGSTETEPQVTRTPVTEQTPQGKAPTESEPGAVRSGRPAVRPEAPRRWTGTLNEFGKRLRWPTRAAKAPAAPGANELPVEKVSLDEVRGMGVDEPWARQQAKVYRDIAESEIGTGNPSARPRAEWLKRLADRLRDEPPGPGAGPGKGSTAASTNKD